MTNIKLQELEDAYTVAVETARENALINMTSRRLRSATAIDDSLKRESISSITTVLKAVAEHLEFDMEKLESTIKNSRKSEYGRVPELLTVLTKMYAWPVNSVDEAKEIDDKQEEIRELLAERNIRVTHDLLLDVKESKGYHSFLDTNSYEIVDGVEPEYDDFNFYITSLAESMNIPYVDFKLDETKWDKNEAKALTKIQLEHEAAQTALKAHEALNNA